MPVKHLARMLIYGKWDFKKSVCVNWFAYYLFHSLEHLLHEGSDYVECTILFLVSRTDLDTKVFFKCYLSESNQIKWHLSCQMGSPLTLCSTRKRVINDGKGKPHNSISVVFDSVS